MRISAADIDALLPQTQCERCGYSGCLPYAQALASGAAPLNRCAPGGVSVIEALADLLQQPALPPDPQCGLPGSPSVAWIDATACIGCARCLPACPVDAIIGAQRQLHTVLHDWCNGCELCVAACPVDCIHMRSAVVMPTPEANRQRYQAHCARAHRDAEQQATLLAARKRASTPDAPIRTIAP